MQYGHCVTCATATAISCLVLPGSAPSRKTAWLNCRKAASASGANSLRLWASALVACGYMLSLIATSSQLAADGRLPPCLRENGCENERDDHREDALSRVLALARR